MLSGDASPVHVAQGWSKLPLVDVVRALLAWQVDLGRILAGAPERVLNRDLVPLLERAANCLGSSGMERFYIRLQQALGWCTSTANPNAQLLLESLLLDCRQYTA
jgi:hypothetical protein